VGAWRAAVVRIERGVPERPPAIVPEVALLDGVTAPALVETRLAALGAPAPKVEVEGARALEALRALAEFEAARGALAGLEAGDLLLLDGPLAPREPAPPAALLGALLSDARARGVDVAGVAKSTTATLSGVPALAAAERVGRGVPAPWAIELPPRAPGVLSRAVRLNVAGRRVFRVDVAAAEGRLEAVLGTLAALSVNPGYPGYPYPLALAHNAAVLTEEEQKDLVERLRARAARRGLSEAAWEAAFHDYHEELERGQ